MSKNNGSKPTPDFSVLKTWPVVSWKWPRPVIYIPLFAALPFADDVLPYFIEIARHGTPFIHLPYGFADQMRNKAVDVFLQSEFTHLLMLDADHKHPHDILQRLIRWCIEDPEKKIIGGLNFRRCEPYNPCAFVRRDGKGYSPHEWEQGIAEMDMVGAGSLLVAKEVFEAIEWPWFKNEEKPETHDLGSHDLYFCKKAAAAGFHIWLDTTTTSPHMAVHSVTEQTYRSFREMNPPPEEELINA